MSDHNVPKPIDVLASFRDKYHADGLSTELGVVANAINDVLPSLDKLNHLRVALHTLRWREVGYEEEKVAMYDDRAISQEDVLSFINSGEVYDPRIVVMSRKQYEQVYGGKAYEED